MRKSRAMRRLIYMAVVVCIGVLLCSIGFNVPFTNYKFNGFFNGALKSTELQQGLVAVYNIEKSNLDSDYRKDIETTKQIIEDFFSARNQSVKVNRVGNDKLQVEINSIGQAETMLNRIGNNIQLNFRGSAGGEKAILGTELESITVERNSAKGGYGAYFKFNEEATAKLTTLTSEIVSNSESLHIYGGEDGESEIQTISLSQAITDGVLFLTGDMNTYDESQNYVSQFINGIFPVKLSLASTSYVYLTEPNMQNGVLFSAIALATFIVLSIVFISIRYRHLGLVTAMSLVANMVLTLGITSSISIIEFSYYGIFALALSYFVAFICNLITLEKIKREYANGKKLPGSFKAGMNKSIFPILDMNIIPVLLGLLLLWVGNIQVKSFGFVISIGFAINLFTSLLLTRGLLNTYLTYNSTKPAKINFKREDNVDEIA